MKFFALLTSILLSSAAMATPGDLECYGTNKQGEIVTMLLAYDNHGQTAPSFINVRVQVQNGSIGFKYENIVDSMINMGTNEEPFLNTLWSSSDEESNLVFRIPEQDPEATELSAFLSIQTDIPGVNVEDALVVCPY